MARRGDLSFQQLARIRNEFIQKMSTNKQNPDSLLQQFTQKGDSTFKSTPDKSDTSQRLAVVAGTGNISFRRLSSLLHEREGALLGRLGSSAERMRLSSQRPLPLYNDVEVLRQEDFIDSGQKPQSKRDHDTEVDEYGLRYFPNDYLYSRQKDFTGRTIGNGVDNEGLNGAPLVYDKGNFQNDDLNRLLHVLSSDKDADYTGGKIKEEDNLTIDLISKRKINVPYMEEKVSVNVQPYVDEINDLMNTRDDTSNSEERETFDVLENLQ